MGPEISCRDKGGDDFKVRNGPALWAIFRFFFLFFVVVVKDTGPEEGGETKIKMKFRRKAWM